MGVELLSAKKDDGTYAVWSSWNQELNTLNHGHYNLKATADCEKIFEEHQNIHPYYEVYKYSQKAKFPLFVACTEESAKQFCESHGWEWKDENDFLWNLDYREL